MSRLPPIPDLDWREDGAPVSRTSDDVYFSADDGLAETRAVFLAGCGLPQRWAGRASFTVAELGFGTGLNFLALWALWRNTRPHPNAHLHFVSFEGFPLTREQAARALARWPQLETLAARLLASWPDRARGTRRLDWPDDGISLTLHIDEISAGLPASRFRADAWFLDGFSPARNADMWDEALYPLIAERCAPDAQLGTYTVAGAVRRGLAEAGFSVTKQAGHGRKRERLEAVFTGLHMVNADPFALRAPDAAPKRVAILGAGIAGASAARALLDRGVNVSVFDEAPAPASGASGNPLALLMPRLDVGDTVQARLLLDAYLHARTAYAGRPGTHETQVRQMPRNAGEHERFAKLLVDPPLPLEDLEAIAGGGLLHKRALILRPADLIGDLLRDADLRLGAPVAVDIAARTVNADSFDSVILANGMAAQDHLPWLGLAARLGQVEHVDSAPEAPASAVASGHYALALGQDRLWGATFEAHDGAPEIREAARAANADALDALSPWWRVQVRSMAPLSRAGLRATTPDRLPLIGAAPDEPAARNVFAPMKKGRAVDAHAPVLARLYMVTGFGARGFTWGPWAASILAAQLHAEPAPAPLPALEAVSPMRLIRRALKRGA